MLFFRCFPLHLWCIIPTYRMFSYLFSLIAYQILVGCKVKDMKLSYVLGVFPLSCWFWIHCIHALDEPIEPTHTIREPIWWETRRSAVVDWMFGHWDSDLWGVPKEHRQLSTTIGAHLSAQLAVRQVAMHVAAWPDTQLVGHGGTPALWMPSGHPPGVATRLSVITGAAVI